MKNNFYKKYLKNMKNNPNFIENENVVYEKQTFLSKTLQYFSSFIYTLFRITIFVIILILLSVGATVIFNLISKSNLI